jgi:hypothetical protein
MTGTSEYCASSWSALDLSPVYGLLNGMTHFDFRMSPCSSKQTLAHATKDTRRVCNSLINAKLDIISAEEQRATPQKHSSSFGRDASSGTSLGEKKGDSAMCQGLCRNGQRRARRGFRRIEGFVEFFRCVLEDEGVVEDMVDLLDGEVCKSHQMARRRHPAAAANTANEGKESSQKSNAKE